MKQLLIVKDGTTLNSGLTVDANDLSTLSPGAIAIFQLSDNALITATPSEKFGLALGIANSVPFVISEVDSSTLKVTKTVATAGVNFTSTVTIPTPSDGKEYTIMMVKKGVAPNERNKWSATYKVKGTIPAPTVAAALATSLNAMQETTNLTVTSSGSNVVINGKSNEDWEIIGADDLFGATISITHAQKAIGDKAYVEELASKCAAGKGFNDTYADGPTNIPGYPEPVENINYNIYTLRFANNRESGKTRDERVTQLVHIAVPKPDSGNDILDTVLGVNILPVED